MERSIPDATFRALADVHRRRLLIALLEQDPGDELFAPDVVGSGDPTVETIALELRHVHLPMLDDRGFVEWDREANSVSAGPNFEEIRPLLVLMDRHRNELPDCWI